MHNPYRDIREKMGEPKWWDEHAVPRYCEFSPDEAANIYAEEVALVEIQCQDCHERMLVCFSWNKHSDILLEEQFRRTKPMHERVDGLYFGDPPGHNCRGAGETMTSDSFAVVQFWRKDENFDWQRMPECERRIGGPVVPE